MARCRARLVRAHAESVRDRLELFGFLMECSRASARTTIDAQTARAPDPSTDDSLIHVRWKLAERWVILYFSLKTASAGSRRNRFRWSRTWFAVAAMRPREVSDAVRLLELMYTQT